MYQVFQPSSKMDYEKYYDKRGDGSYIVHFPNNKGISMSDLHRMFSQFGEVLSINDRGQSHGLCFVRYKNIDEVKKCIHSFQNHKEITILPHKNKMKGFKAQKTPYKEGMQTSFKANTNNELTSKHCKSDNDRIDSDNLSDNSTISLKTDNTHNYSTKRRSFLKDLFYLKTLQLDASSTSVSSGLTNKTTRLVETTDEKEMPALISVDQKSEICDDKSASESCIIVPAHEVIVANIHQNLSIFYILHLFEKFNPISVSLMKMTPVRGIRYCHVYYKTLEDAFSTIKEFDTYCLHGKNLIVSTPQKLMQEAC